MRRGYKAFISYKHHADLPFAERIAKALRTYARPLLKPPLRIFRDEEYLLPNESLPKAIRAALEDSSFLVLLASPECAASVWVSEELQIWCAALQRSDRLLIVLTHGEIVFDTATKWIDWSATTALPRLLADHLRDLPLYVDLRWITDERELDLLNADFKKVINRLAAALSEVDPELMLNTEVMVHRRNIWLSRGATAALAIFAVIAGVGFFVAQNERTRAEKALANEQVARARAETQAQAAAANLLAARARQAGAQLPQLGVLLAAEAVQRLLAHNQPVTTAAAQALIDIFTQVAGIGLRGHRLAFLPGGAGDADTGTFVSAVAISPDSKWIATGDGDGRVLLRRRAQPAAWIELLPGRPTSFLAHQEEIDGLAFSADSTRLAATKFGDARVWEVSDQPRQIARCALKDDFVPGVQFTDDRRWLLITSQAGVRTCDSESPQPQGVPLPEARTTVLASGGELVVSAQGRLWRWRDHKVDARLPGFDDGARLFTSSAQGDKLAAGTDAGKLHVWTLGSMAHQVFEQGGPVEAIAFSPDGASLAVASRGRLVRIWDLTGHNKPRVFEHPGEVETIAFHPSGQTLATAGGDGRVRLWSTNWDYTAAPVVLDGIAGSGRANSLKFSADGSFLIAAGFEPIARLWPLAALNPGVQLLRGSQYGSYEAMAAGNAPLRVAAVTRVAAPDVWTLDQPDAAPVAMAQGFNNASQVALSADGRWIATAGVGTRSQLWQLAAPQLAPRVLLAGAAEHNKVLFSPDSALIAGLQQDGSILLESTANAATAPRTLSPASAQAAVDFAFDPGGGRLAAVYQDGSAYLWTLRDAQRTPLAGASDKREASSIAFSHDGQHVAIAGAGFIDWQALAGQSVRRLDAPAGRLLTKIAMAATGSLLAAGTRDGTTLLWDTAAGGPPRELPGHVHAVIDLAFTADGRSLAALTPESIRLWSLHDLAAPPLRLDGKRLKTFGPAASAQASALTSITFLNDGRIAASTGEHAVAVWDLNWASLVQQACVIAGRSLSANEVVDYLDGIAATACLGPPRPR